MLQSQQRKLNAPDEHYPEKLNETEHENRALRTQSAQGHCKLVISGKKPVQSGHPTSFAV